MTVAGRYRAARLGVLAALALTLVQAGAADAAPRTVWVGTYTLPRGTPPVAVLADARGATATVSLGPGHAWAQSVPVVRAGDRVAFALPGRPGPLRFAGRISGRTWVGAVTQGQARGTFRLAAAGGSVLSALGVFALDGGRVAAVEDYRRVASQLWVIDYSSGAFHALRPSGAGFAVGPTVLRRSPPVGSLSVRGDRLAWTTRGVGTATGNRLPIRQYEVRFPSGSAVLAGTLSVPVGPERSPAVALVHGSGPSLRDEGQFFAALLLQHGIAVLSYDKRGNGESGGLYPGERATPQAIAAYAADADAALRFLGRQPDLDSARLGLVGGSQAGWIIPLAAAHSSSVRFAVIQSGPTVTVGETEYFAALTSLGAVPLPRPLAEIEASVEQAGPSGFDPRPWIRRLDLPILWLFGGVDLNQPSHLDIDALGQIAAETGHDDTWKLYPHGDHSILEVATGLQAELPASRGMPAAFFTDVSEWLRAHGFASR